MKVIAIANQKGGVGKTTTTIELGFCLAELGKKVLLIDFDQQANLTKYLDAKNDLHISKVMNGEINIEDSVQHLDKIDIISATSELSKADKTYIDADDIFLLEDICTALEEEYHYDYVLIDNSPSRNILLTMSYVASDYIVIPTEVDDGAIDGILAIERDVSKLRDGKRKYSHAEVGMILLTKYENTNLHNDTEETLNEISEQHIKGNPKIKKIRKSIKSSEAKAFRKSMQDYMKYNNVAVDYREVARELLQKVEE